MKKQRPGSWSVLLAGLALSYSLARWVASRIPYLFIPISFLVKFLTERYYDEIDSIGKWCSRKVTSIWNIFRRRQYVN